MATLISLVQRIAADIRGRAPLTHMHTISDVTGLRTELDELDAPHRTAPPAGLKVVPLVMTTGNSARESDLPERGLRLPMRWEAPVYRWRLHVRNWNPRLSQAKSGAMSLTGVWVADHDGDGAISNVVPVHPGSAMPSDGSEWVSAWSDVPLGRGADRMLVIGYSGDATAAPYNLIGGSWQTVAAADAAVPGAAVVASDRTPLDVWIEAETPASTPVIAGVGDSLTAGVGATLPVYDSWVAQYARSVGALPMVVAHSGDDVPGFLWHKEKWQRFSSLARADAVVWALGSNDIHSARTLAQIQDYFETLFPLIEEHIGAVAYAVTVPPRNGWGTEKEAKRAAWTDWLVSRPQIRGTLDFASVMSDDGDTIRPEFDSGDGTHFNTAGYTAQAASITTPLTAIGATA